MHYSFCIITLKTQTAFIFFTEEYPWFCIYELENFPMASYVFVVYKISVYGNRTYLDENKGTIHIVEILLMLKNYIFSTMKILNKKYLFCICRRTLLVHFIAWQKLSKGYFEKYYYNFKHLKNKIHSFSMR